MAMPVTGPTPTYAAVDAQPTQLSGDAEAEARRLAASVARGDEAAFRQLYDRYHERLFRLVLVLNHGDESLAHEVVQSAMLTAAAKLKSVESEKHLWHWLAQVARQDLAKQWRRRKREPALVALEEWSDWPGVGEADTRLEQSLDAALLALEHEERQVVEWFYFDGLRQNEIAERLHITPKAVSSRLERSRAKLRLIINRILSHET
jgi:RNA polymerase sigma-70 factor (ECF subfamily)